MPLSLDPKYCIYAISTVSMVGVLWRPWRVPEALWACLGAVAIVALGFVPWRQAAIAVARGGDVYMFLAGMMLISELSRREGLFDYVAAVCVRRAGGSSGRLFMLVYAVGTLVTVFMSNDATAVVLTPAVLAVTRKAKVTPLPYLLACAFIANAASFVLPISNPANLVVFGDRLPALFAWFERFALPSALAIGSTYGLLRWMHRRELREAVANSPECPALTTSAKLAAAGLGFTAVVLLIASAMGLALGLPTLLAAGLVCTLVLARKREAPTELVRHLSWSILPLVAGLFVLVEALERAGVLAMLARLMETAAAASTTQAAMLAGVVIALGCNLVNNLPAGLVAGSVMSAAKVQAVVQSATAIGVDLGPNLSVTGSLATLLWLAALRREGETVTGWQFLKAGMFVMPASLALALLGLLLQTQLAS